MNVEYRENTLTPEEYLEMERRMGDPLTTKEQAECAIANQLFSVVAMEDNQETGIPGTAVSLCLMCAKGKEGFYEKLGFFKRPVTEKAQEWKWRLSCNITHILGRRFYDIPATGYTRELLSVFSTEKRAI